MNEQQSYCLREYGFFVEQLDVGGPALSWIITVPAGVDPADGQPLFRRRLANEYEIELWAARDYGRLADGLRMQGVPGIRKPAPWWKRVKRRLTGR